MRTITTRADLFGPSAGISYSMPNAPQSQNSSGQGQPIPVTTVFGNLKNSIFSQPLTWLAGFVLFLIGWKLLEEKHGVSEDFKDVKIGVSNWFKIGIMMVLFFAVAKFLTTKYDIPGFSKLVGYATGG